VNGRTVTRVLSDEQLAAYQPTIDKSRRLRELLAELHELTLAAALNDDASHFPGVTPRWGTTGIHRSQAAPPGAMGDL